MALGSALVEIMGQTMRMPIQQRFAGRSKAQIASDVVTMNTLVDRVIAERRANPIESVDLLNLMLTKADPDSGDIHSAAMHVIERFTRMGNTLRYAVTVEDPEMFTKPWSPRPLKPCACGALPAWCPGTPPSARCAMRGCSSSATDQARSSAT